MICTSLNVVKSQFIFGCFYKNKQRVKQRRKKGETNRNEKKIVLSKIPTIKARKYAIKNNNMIKTKQKN